MLQVLDTTFRILLRVPKEMMTIAFCRTFGWIVVGGQMLVLILDRDFPAGFFSGEDLFFLRIREFASPFRLPVSVAALYCYIVEGRRVIRSISFFSPIVF